MTSHRRSLSEADRAERREADRQRVEQAARQLLSSDGWQRWVTIRSRNGLGRYTLNNQLLIALQKPDATYVAGFRAFLKLDRCVRKGETAIRILAPIPLPASDERDAETSEQEERRVLFRSVAVFDTLSRDLWSARIRGGPRRGTGAC